MMKKKILIVEDEYVEANDLKLILERAGYIVSGMARSVHAALDLIEKERPDFALLDITLKGTLTGIDLAKLLAPKNIPFIFLSANCSEETLEAAKATQPYGYLIKPFRTNEVLAAIGIANYRHDNSLETILRQESILRSQLDNVISEGLTQAEAMLRIGMTLQSYFSFDYLGCEFYKEDMVLQDVSGFYRVGFNEYRAIPLAEIENIFGAPVLQYKFIHDIKEGAKPSITDLENQGFCYPLSEVTKKMVRHLKMTSILSIPVELAPHRWYWLCFGAKQQGLYSNKHLELAGRLHGTLTVALRQIMGITDRPKNAPSSTLQPRKKVENDVGIFNGIVGRNHQLLSVFDQIKQVAPMDTSVLILGESGTGKERIAECIHLLSGRKAGPFIKINCAGFPSSLIESELFGHEKGAFTGALEKRIGKFELADKGTIFLDEIGEMPLESQVKILRVLQERQIERLGGRAPISVDIRIIAATNRNLEHEVANDRFRLDLYYRLNVFPIILPPLRERRDDIPDLVRHFINLFNLKTGRQINDIDPGVKEAMQNYSWPGNIRELEHVMERSLIMTNGNIMERVLLPGITIDTKKMAAPIAPIEFKNYKDFERDYLASVLEKCNGRLSGKNGAAAVLGLPVSTLNSKLIKLGLKKEKD